MGPIGMSFERLVSQAQPADLDDELEKLLADSGSLAFKVAYSVLRQREDAEDVGQEALARAFRNRDRLRDRESFRSWLVRICWRLALDHLRSRRRRERREQRAALVGLPANVEDVAAENEFRERLWRAIDALPDKLRRVVVLAALEGHGVDKVATLLGLPAGTVKSRLFLARRRLAETLR